MIITLKKDTPIEEIKKIKSLFEEKAYTVARVENDNLRFGAFKDESLNNDDEIFKNSWISNVTKINSSFKFSSRAFKADSTVVKVGSTLIGGNNNIVFMAGPCAVESLEQIEEIAHSVKDANAKVLRGGAYKMRTSPYSFQGLGRIGLEYLFAAKNKYNIPVVSEITSIKDIDDFVKYVDIIQVGARNMQNIELLKALGKINKPIILKRGQSSTVEEWLMSADYILSGGNKQVILCERGIRTFEKMTRNTLDLSIIPLIKQISHLPIIVDPSHATGDSRLVEAMTLASIASGSDGILLEVHCNPDAALSDGKQSLRTEDFKNLVIKARKVALAIGRDV